MNVSIAEIQFLIAGLVLLCLGFLISVLNESFVQILSFQSVAVSVLFWVLSFRAYSLLIHGYASLADVKESTADAAPKTQAWKILAGIGLKAAALSILALFLLSAQTFAARSFALATVGQLFLGSILTVFYYLFSNKGK